MGYVPLDWRIYMYYLEFLSMWDFSLPHLFIWVWTHEYLLHNLDYNSIWPIYFIAQIFLALAIESNFNCLLCPFDLLIYLCHVFLNFFFFLAFSYILALYMLQVIHLVYYLPQTYNWSISPGSSGLFHWRMILETKILVLHMLIATGVSLFQAFSVERAMRYMCIY